MTLAEEFNKNFAKYLVPINETYTAHEDIQMDMAHQLADQLMSIIGYDEDRPEIEGLITDKIYDNYDVSER
jgi:hypothetical protein